MGEQSNSDDKKNLSKSIVFQAQSTNHQAGEIKHAHKFIFGYVLLIFFAAIAGGIYTWQHNKVETLNKQTDSLNSQVKNLNKQVSSLKQSNTTLSNTSSQNKVNNCVPSQLKIASTNPNGAAGTDSVIVVLTNTSSDSCTLYGYPIIQYKTASNSFVPNISEQLQSSMAFANPPPTLITLNHNQSASFGLTFTTVGEINPNTSTTLIYLPGNSTALVVNKALGPSIANSGQPFDILVTSIQNGSTPQPAM